MIARLPVIPTIVVLIAVGVMIRLGLWQMDRMQEKEAMLARYEQAAGSSESFKWPGSDPEAVAPLLFARSDLTCEKVEGLSSIAGKNAQGESGLSITAQCRLAGGGEGLVVLGWSRSPVTPDWKGGNVAGIIAPGPRLVADPPLAGLEANAQPDPRDIPNNHWSYAVQWFLFAGVALVIYALAVRKRLAGGGEPS
ncbi:MAG: SURF1 family cytochrome oxidase biogenesis protein [Sphingomonadaceae bacterium]|jgi:cytochrome oxidase assembly protein ShyY1